MKNKSFTQLYRNNYHYKLGGLPEFAYAASSGNGIAA